MVRPPPFRLSALRPLETFSGGFGFGPDDAAFDVIVDQAHRLHEGIRLGAKMPALAGATKKVLDSRTTPIIDWSMAFSIWLLTLSTPRFTEKSS